MNDYPVNGSRTRTGHIRQPIEWSYNLGVHVYRIIHEASKLYNTKHVSIIIKTGLLSQPSNAMEVITLPLLLSHFLAGEIKVYWISLVRRLKG